MPEDLRLPGERDRVPALVALVVAVPGKEGGVGAARPARRDPHQDLVRPRAGGGDVAHFDPPDIDEHRRFHRLGPPEPPEPPEPPKPPKPPPTCISITDAIVLGGTRGSCIAKPESARSIVSGVPSASSAADSGRSETPVSVSRPSLGQSNTWAYSLPRLAG